jgi:tight adherence protein B
MSVDPTLALKLGGVLSLTLALVVLVFAAASRPDSPLHRLYFRYVNGLERRMRLMFIDVRGVHVALGQLVAALLSILAAIFLSSPIMLLLLPVVVIGPNVYLTRKQRQRVLEIERKLDGFVVSLANALRASPSPGRALAMIQPATPAPLDREIELVLREMRVGSTLEQALGNMSARVQSFQLDAAMTGLLIGRQTGGDVPAILDGAAHTLREVSRLQGVLRAKTAEGRAQANVLAVFPLFLIFAFDLAKPGYFRPLTASTTGFTVMLIALVMWIASVLMIRRIMDVEL